MQFREEGAQMVNKLKLRIREMQIKRAIRYLLYPSEWYNSTGQCKYWWEDVWNLGFSYPAQGKKYCFLPFREQADTT